MTEKKDCDICSGSRVVRLPIHRPVSIRPFDADATIEASWREYPCPECGQWADSNRLAMLQAHVMLDKRIDDPRLKEHARASAAHALVEQLIRGDYITFEEVNLDFSLSYPLIATLGVVSKEQVATLESRIAERQDAIAKAVAEQAIQQINNWGSAYGTCAILKERAVQIIREAVRLDR